ncbi:hypothetical protein OOU_Y34scaffold00824g4 [Pyricularia oryzae Y34]|uniref:Alpha N-terminal protein methyltransferase 1 n=1 Tax=Pyricularia oryzae (strain Y34) TaxID=1143189 RepID=A0AA97NPP3_PYRO3|nr:hypothetical protein OOU_Y34scaffold00824g4 [Pyricularia oryzae Y34]
MPVSESTFKANSFNIMEPGHSSVDSGYLIDKEKSTRYWEDANADDDGMLGGVSSVAGFSSTSKIDLQGSRGFLAKLGVGRASNRRTVDCALEGGAGIGRVTGGLLSTVASHIDIIEPVAKFNTRLRENACVRQIFNVGLEEWLPADGVLYDLVWIQWCVGYLTDEHLVGFLMRCQQALNPENGVIVMKENISTSDADYFDDTDNSLTRKDSKFRNIFCQAGLRIIRTELQRGLSAGSPRKLLPVRMYALKPRLC